jgi:hypothetical protein
MSMLRRIANLLPLRDRRGWVRLTSASFFRASRTIALAADDHFAQVIPRQEKFHRLKILK